MINIAVVTTTRAEYGLLRSLLFALEKDCDFNLNLIISGTHLSKKYGYTIEEIKKDKLPIKKKIEIIDDNKKEINIGETISRTISKFAKYFSKNRFDYMFIDSDRYEMLGVCIAAVINNIPIIHCGGGEVTEGANDEYWRHAITKLSYLHIATTSKHAKRIINMGENPNRVFNVGSPGIENIKTNKYRTKKELEKRLNHKLDKDFALVTYHPVTLNVGKENIEIKELSKAINSIKDMIFIITKPNADKGNEIIEKELEKLKNSNRNVILVSSLGSEFYLCAMKYCDFVMGNSSSGIIEAPSFKKPTVNIGNRQKGRERAKSVIDCDIKCEEILKAVKKARSKTFKDKCRKTKNPYGNGKVSAKIIKIIKNDYKTDNRYKYKIFYDVNTNTR